MHFNASEIRTTVIVVSLRYHDVTLLKPPPLKNPAYATAHYHLFVHA